MIKSGAEYICESLTILTSISDEQRDMAQDKIIKCVEMDHGVTVYMKALNLLKKNIEDGEVFYIFFLKHNIF